MKISKILILSAAALSLTACGEHTHTFASEWTYDETNHWHAATCEHTELVSDLSAHNFGDDNICDDCGYTKPTPAHEHTYATEWTYDETNHWHVSTCEHTGLTKDFAEHNFGDDNICDDCGYTKPTPAHEHTYATEWTYDETNHWHVSTCEHTGLTKDFAEHNFGDDNICDDCGYTKPTPAHEHTYATEWTYDETNHWHAATCEHTEEKSGVAAHTLRTDGKCTVCDYTTPPTPPSVTYNVSFNGVKCTSNAQASYNEGQEVTIQITPNEGYAYPQEVYVYGGAYSYNKYDGTLKFTINEDTTIYCASFEKPKYYLSAEYNDEVIHSRSELSEDGKELVSTYYYEIVDVYTSSYENGRLTNFKEVEKLNEGDVESDFKNYTYENGNIVRVDFPDDEDGTKNFELREYDEYNRITKSVSMWGEEAYNLTTFEYPDNFTCISKWYFENFDFETEERIEECKTNIKKVTIDIEHNTKRVDYVESYRSSEKEYTGYEVYTFDTGKLIERLYSDWSAYDIFEYNEYGDMISNTTSKYDSDTEEWHEDTKVTIEYNEDRSLKHIESASPLDSDTEHGYFTVCDYICNENGLIVSEIDKTYQDGDNYYTRNATFEYKELKFDLYDDDYGGRTNINYGRTIGTYDLDFWYGF